MTDHRVLKGPRITGIDRDTLPSEMSRVFELQTKKWGQPLRNHLIYARCPEIFKAANGMWAGLAKSGLLEGTLSALINRRVAMLNGCVF